MLPDIDADGAGAGDEHVFADEVERQRRVRRVPERVEDGDDVVGNVVRHGNDVLRRQRKQLGERARTVHADALRVRAQVATPRAAVAAVAAHDVAFAGNALPDFEMVDVFADFFDVPDVFVPDDHRHGNRLLRPLVPLVDVDVRAADGGFLDANQNVVRPAFGFGNVHELQARFRFIFYESFHDA